MGKKQHYIPQFYMKKFSNNGKSVGLYIFEYEKYIIDASIKDINYKHYFYGQNNANEELLSELEGKWNTIIDKIIMTHKITGDEEEYIFLLMLLTVSYGRTLAMANELEKSLKDLVDIMAEMSVDINPDFKNQRYDVTFKYTSTLLLKSSIKITPILCDLKPILLLNETNCDFITSDCPLNSYNQMFIARNYKHAYGLSQVGLQLFFPISPRVCLCLYDSIIYKAKVGFDGNIHISSKRDINEINKLFVLNADKILMFNNNINKKTIGKYVRYQKKHNKRIDKSSVVKCYDPENKYLGKGVRLALKSVYEKIQLRFFSIDKRYLKLPLSQGLSLKRPQIEEFPNEQL